MTDQAKAQAEARKYASGITNPAVRDLYNREQTSAAKTYNVQIGGKTIKTASDADAQNLISALKQASLTA
jgi:hypothetical protein